MMHRFLVRNHPLVVIKFVYFLTQQMSNKWTYLVICASIRSGDMDRHSLISAFSLLCKIVNVRRGGNQFFWKSLYTLWHSLLGGIVLLGKMFAIPTNCRSFLLLTDLERGRFIISIIFSQLYLVLFFSSNKYLSNL